ncbi:hypothetical protein [Mycetocola spongiae]|uniref:hypothetical protein n=1 Tax=Mycetocola spongiae TaxID=2859226 RepID=UPI001CF33D3B|nr:hypothetical protein [Mycetocola spongiae]UCR89104.1 hypothetical protein KXZ72_14405 [Mycetocola spongiae]
MTSTGREPQRIELHLRAPRPRWAPRPTVVFGGRGQPAQWGVGTWMLPAERPARVGVYLFNRLWKYGAASIIITADAPAVLEYRAPLLPFLPGKLRALPGPEAR